MMGSSKAYDARVLAERQFTAADQECFAQLSGDRNPIHMDSVAARRTVAGAPIVHGVHTCLWALECLLQPAEALRPSTIAATFTQAIYVGDIVRLSAIRDDPQSVSLKAYVGSALVLNMRVSYGASNVMVAAGAGSPVLRPVAPRELHFAELSDEHGQVPFAGRPTDGARMFPAVSRILGARRVAGLACASYIVGMVCPGLHSIFGGLKLAATMEPLANGEWLDFRVGSTDMRFSMLKLVVSGGGWVGEITCFARPEPVAQPEFRAVAGFVDARAFAGTSVLIIGGSRGLGELVAKIAAAGGAAVTITYCSGQEDAARLQSTLIANGAVCEVMRYDVLADAGPQLAALRDPPDIVYYFATPTIARARRSAFEPERLKQFIDFYVIGFHSLCLALRARFEDEIALFYPSSAYVEERPGGLTEYAMAKAAGEILCETLPAADRPGPVTTIRLPPLSTDQTATVLAVETVDATSLMVKVVTEMHRNHRSVRRPGTLPEHDGTAHFRR